MRGSLISRTPAEKPDSKIMAIDPDLARALVLSSDEIIARNCQLALMRSRILAQNWRMYGLFFVLLVLQDTFVDVSMTASINRNYNEGFSQGVTLALDKYNKGVPLCQDVPFCINPLFLNPHGGYPAGILTFLRLFQSIMSLLLMYVTAVNRESGFYLLGRMIFPRDNLWYPHSFFSKTVANAVLALAMFFNMGFFIDPSPKATVLGGVNDGYAATYTDLCVSNFNETLCPIDDQELQSLYSNRAFVGQVSPLIEVPVLLRLTIIAAMALMMIAVSRQLKRFDLSPWMAFFGRQTSMTGFYTLLLQQARAGRYRATLEGFASLALARDQVVHDRALLNPAWSNIEDLATTGYMRRRVWDRRRGAIMAVAFLNHPDFCEACSDSVVVPVSSLAPSLGRSGAVASRRGADFISSARSLELPLLSAQFDPF